MGNKKTSTKSRAIIDVAIALDVAMSGVMAALATNPVMRNQLAFYLKEMIEFVPGSLAPECRPGVAALLQKWHGEISATPPMN